MAWISPAGYRRVRATRRLAQAAALKVRVYQSIKYTQAENNVKSQIKYGANEEIDANCEHRNQGQCLARASAIGGG